MQNTAEILKIQANDQERISFRFWLQHQLTDRCKKNPRYSLRAFAKSLSLDPSSLSQILSGKRPLSKKAMLVLCEKLGTTPNDLKSFGLVKNNIDGVDDYFHINLDTFAVISEWYHYAILELTYVSGFKADPKWIARKLSITVEVVKAAVNRLKRLGLLIEKNGSLLKSAKLITNQSLINTSAAHKELQRHVIEKALSAIDECSAEEKDITSMTMAIDVSKIDQARELTRRYRREMCALMENGEQTQVYNLGIQLYPISKTKDQP